MAIDVDWVTGLITIPKLDMPLVQASPEIRSLDVEQLHLDLRTIHASVVGAPYPRTHTHKGESVLSGETYARIVEIIPPYTLEFENDQYAVVTSGANHNILDVKIANQVSLLVQNSAGLIRATAVNTVVETATVLSGSTNEEIRTTLIQGNGFWDGVTFLIEETIGGIELPSVVLTYTLLNGTLYPAATLPFVPLVNTRVKLLASRGSIQ